MSDLIKPRTKSERMAYEDGFVQGVLTLVEEGLETAQNEIRFFIEERERDREEPEAICSTTPDV